MTEGLITDTNLFAIGMGVLGLFLGGVYIALRERLGQPAGIRVRRPPDR